MPVRRVVALAALLLLPTLPGQAASTNRVVSVPYSIPAGVATGDGATLFGTPTASATSAANEDKVTVSAHDASGAVALVVDVTTKAGATKRRVVCAALTVPVSAGTKVAATPVAGYCTSGTVSAPTGGTVTLSFHRKPPPPSHAAGAPPSMRWAVVIGVGDYGGSTHSTVGGSGDADVVRTALLRAGWLSDHILVLKDSQATASGISNAFDWLAQRSTPRTFSLMHFSGHVCIASRGPCASGHTYLWSYDNRFIPETFVKSRMSRVRGHSWLDVAGCEAGAFDLHSSSRLFSASSKASETSYENPQWHQSYWAGLLWDRGFLQGLADDRGMAARATIGEMTAYAKRQAPPMTAKGEKGSQHPVVVGGNASWTLYAPPGG
ncbi:MAG TPA: caspase family protein [Mycobacteriales bacterium]|nr:caspase family protein [Mycobacteriales bacterium]